MAIEKTFGKCLRDMDAQTSKKITPSTRLRAVIASLAMTRAIAFAGCDSGASGQAPETDTDDAGVTPVADLISEGPNQGGPVPLVPCEAPQIHEVSVPLRYENPTDGTIRYRYQVRPPSEPTQPTVIFLGGGPSFSYIEPGGIPSVGIDALLNTDQSDASDQSTNALGIAPFISIFRIPDTWGIVMTDQRGTGCNRLAEGFGSDDFLSTATFVQDLQSIVTDLNLDNYVLFGTSYGSMVATIAASALTPSPAVTMLDSVFAQADPPTFGEDVLTAAWQQTWGDLSPDVQAAFQTPTLPGGASALDWGTYLSTQYLTLEIPPGSVASELERMLQSTGVRMTADTLQDEFSGEATELSEVTGYAERLEAEASFDENPQVKRILESVYCREMAETVRLTFSLSSDALSILPGPVDHCAAVQLDRAYSSAEHPIPSPIVYINGDRDLSTPHERAWSHFMNQTQSDRTYLKVLDGAHGAISELSSNCLSNLWIWAYTRSDIETLPTHCHSNVEISHAPGQ